MTENLSKLMPCDTRLQSRGPQGTPSKINVPQLHLDTLPYTSESQRQRKNLESSQREESVLLREE